MFSFDDTNRFGKVLALEVRWAHSYADMRHGKADRERRENFRNAASGRRLLGIPSNRLWWAFRISVRKGWDVPLMLITLPRPS